jgi:peptidoglycan-associated lipoprotein
MSRKFQEVAPSLIGRDDPFLEFFYQMKRAILINVFLAVVLAISGSVGCKRKAKNPTVIPGQVRSVPPVQPDRPVVEPVQPPIDDRDGVTTTPRTGDREGRGTVDENVPQPGKPLGDMKPDPEFFRANTVYFDFDRSTVKESERGKIEAVARHLASNPTHAMRVAGHCDERGTEGYNLALGERRALAVREYLVKLGVSPDRVDTISYGESSPVATGHNEASWKQNRRGEFILLTP